MSLTPSNARLRDAAAERLFMAFDSYGGRSDYDQRVADMMAALIDARFSVDDVSLGPWLERVAIAATTPNALLGSELGPSPVAPSTGQTVFAVGALVAVVGGGAYAAWKVFSRSARRSASRRRGRRRR
jgi:hypothetical protein